MKNFFLTFIISTFFVFCKAQVPTNTPIVPLHTVTTYENLKNLTNNGKYFKDTENRYDQWIGTWQYQDGSITFKIVIQKFTGIYFTKNEFHLPINCYVDILVAGYYYENNGVVISNHLSVINPKTPPLVCSIIYGYPDSNNEKLNINYREYEKAPGLTGGLANFTLLPGSTTQAKWEFDPVKKRNYSVPDNVILTKL